MTKVIKSLLVPIIATIIISVNIAPVFALVPYQTYSYSYWGEVRESPHAYVPDSVKNGISFGLDNNLKDPEDLFVDSRNRVYIADSGNHRIVLLNEKFEKIRVISEFVNPESPEGIDGFNGPAGVYVTEDEKLYVADTNNRRIVILDLEGNLLKIVPQPVSDVFPADFIYNPASLVTDRSGRIYVIARNTNLGVVSITEEGDFLGFLGAQKVTPNLTDIFWRYFMTEQQRSRIRQYVPTEYNNITLDERGFLFVTTSTIEPWAQYNAIMTRSRSGEYAPVKRLNPSGEDVLKRTGFHPPAGDVKVVFGRGTEYGTSTIIDVALNDKGMYTLLDSKRNKLFTYDEDGNLLYVFAGTGRQDGLFTRAVAISYLRDDILVLDSLTGKVTVYKQTEYGRLISEAIEANKTRQFDKSVGKWREVLSRNSNFDLAYLGMGNASFRNGNYSEAADYYKMANNWEGYSKSFRLIRKDFLSNWILIVPVLAILLLILVLKFMKYANGVNTRGQSISAKSGLKGELLYTFHIIFHPFDGFYDMKHEKRGSIKAAAILLGLTIMSFIFRNLVSGYIFAPYRNETFDFMAQIMYVLIPVALWCLANWCLTTLMDGEGSMKDIFMMTSYALTPVLILNIPAGILSNILIIEEAALLSSITNLAYGWTFFLIFIGVMIIHNYSIPKNIVTSVFSIGGMAVITFIALLYFGLMQRIIAFISNIGNEIMFRL